MQPPHNPTTPLDLSEAEMASVQRYADERGITTDEAATELARQTITARYVLRRQQQAHVIPLKRPR